MRIEDETLLKVWIARDVEPLSDAESEALAKYVLALIKKQMADDELEKLCLDRLQDFLGAHTKAFVERLFHCVKTGGYLSSSKSSARPVAIQSASSPTTGSSHQATTTTGLKASPPQPPMERGGEELLSLDNDILEGADEEAEESASSRSVSSRSSDSGTEVKKSEVSRTGTTKPSATAPKPAAEVKKREDVSARRGDSTKTTTSATGRRRPAASPPQSSAADAKRQRSVHQRIDDISPIRNRSANELTSAGMRRGGASGAGGGTRHSRRRSWSRERAAGRDGSRSRSRSPIYRQRGAPERHRCRDFHEKGYCMRGDKCPFDHGPDPVVVEKASAALEKIVGGSGGNPPPPGMERSYGIGTASLVDATGGYNPEAPALNSGTSTANTPKLANFSVPPPPIPAGYIRPGSATLIRHMMPTQMGSATGLTPTHFPPPTVIAAVAGGGGQIQMPNFSTPPPNIGAIPTSALQTAIGQPMSAPMMVPSQVQQRFMRPSMRGGMSGDHRFRPYGMMGPRPSLAATNPALCSLIVKKIPDETNRIPTLDKHFSKFGQITNLHVQYEGRPDWALVTYKTRREAMNAYKSTEPILNNRFIRVFWQTQPGEQLPAEIIGEAIVDTGDGSTPIPSQAEVCKDAIRPPIDLNRTFKKIFHQHQETDVDSEPNEEERTVKSEEARKAPEETALPPPALQSRPTPPPPSFNYRAMAAKRKAASESLLRMRDVHRRKTEIYVKLTQQMKDLLSKIKSATSKDAKLKLMELVKKLDASTKAMKGELEEMAQKITELKLRADDEALKTKAYAPSATGGIAQQAGEITPSLSGDSEANGNDSTSSAPAPPSTPKSLSAEADRKKLFRVVHVTGCAPEMQDELIKHMESFGDLFDFDIGAGRNAPAVFTYKAQSDAQKAVREAASTFTTSAGGGQIKVNWAPASLGQGEGVIPDRERKPHLQMTPRALLASLEGSDEDDESDEEHKADEARRREDVTGGDDDAEDDEAEL